MKGDKNMFDYIKDMNKSTLAIGGIGVAMVGYAIYRGVKECRASNELETAEIPEVASPEETSEA